MGKIVPAARPVNPVINRSFGADAVMRMREDVTAAAGVEQRGAGLNASDGLSCINLNKLDVVTCIRS